MAELRRSSSSVDKDQSESLNYICNAESMLTYLSHVFQEVLALTSNRAIHQQFPAQH